MLPAKFPPDRIPPKAPPRCWCVPAGSAHGADSSRRPRGGGGLHYTGARHRAIFLSHQPLGNLILPLAAWANRPLARLLDPSKRQLPARVQISAPTRKASAVAQNPSCSAAARPLATPARAPRAHPPNVRRRRKNVTDLATPKVIFSCHAQHWSKRFCIPNICKSRRYTGGFPLAFADGILQQVISALKEASAKPAHFNVTWPGSTSAKLVPSKKERKLNILKAKV